MRARFNEINLDYTRWKLLSAKEEAPHVQLGFRECEEKKFKNFAIKLLNFFFSIAFLACRFSFRYRAVNNGREIWGEPGDRKNINNILKWITNVSICARAWRAIQSWLLKNKFSRILDNNVREKIPNALNINYPGCYSGFYNNFTEKHHTNCCQPLHMLFSSTFQLF